jgi:kinesin family protein 11
MKGLLVDADQLLVELQNGLSQQEMNFSTFIEQQHEVHHLSQHLPITYLYSTVYLSSFKKKSTHTGTLQKLGEIKVYFCNYNEFLQNNRFTCFGAQEGFGRITEGTSKATLPASGEV